MNPISFLIEARKILLEHLKKEIESTEIDYSIYQLKIQFTQGTILYIRYNKFNEYAYQVIFSKKKNDFMRYDNFDDKWKVPTKPHHIHSRFKDEVIESPMIGNPRHDIPILIRILKKESFIKKI